MTNFWIAFILITEIIVGTLILLYFNYSCKINDQILKMNELISEKIKEYDTK